MNKRRIFVIVLAFVITTLIPVNICVFAESLLMSENESIETYKCNHEDKTRNHYCDYCTLRLSDHEDKDKNHYCDYCGVLLNDHSDENVDHYCDCCGVALSNHEDSNSNGYCDYCGAVMYTQVNCQHQDADNDHYCDYCKQMISNHKVILVRGAAATYDAAGYRDSYKCKCGKRFEDKECTTEISDYKKWKSEGGKGYLPKLQKMTKDDIIDNGDDNDILLLSTIMMISALCFGICSIYRHLINKD